MIAKPRFWGGSGLETGWKIKKGKFFPGYVCSTFSLVFGGGALPLGFGDFHGTFWVLESVSCGLVARCVSAFGVPWSAFWGSHVEG